WAESIRMQYFADVIKDDIGGARGCIAGRLEIDYRAPLDYREDVAVGCRVSRFGKKSFDNEYEIWSETRRVLAAKITMVLVAYDYTRLQSISIPDEWRERVAAFET
ncbi:MAG: thioesterase family protein, partial [Candidatus Eremiobacteraeota bacterium]|nr:thioesterase family protein [Candidatus Eremiobacteraeota bacterium]